MQLQAQACDSCRSPLSPENAGRGQYRRLFQDRKWYALGSAMALLQSRIERTDDFGRRRERLEALVGELRLRTARVAAGGGERAVERHRSRGKLLARERIDGLVDPGTAFLELNALAAWDLYDGQAP